MRLLFSYLVCIAFGAYMGAHIFYEGGVTACSKSAPAPQPDNPDDDEYDTDPVYVQI